MIEKQKDWITTLQRITMSPVLVATNKLDNGIYRPGVRVEPETDKNYDHRTVLSNEIVFDFDAKVFTQNYKTCKKIIEVLKERQIPYYIFTTGGKGLHLSIFFDKLSLKNEESKKLYQEALSYNFTWTHVRKWLFDLIINESSMSKKEAELLDTKLVVFNELMDSPHLIRVCGGRKMTISEKDETLIIQYKSYIPDEEFKDKRIIITTLENVRYPERIKPFTILESEFCQCLKDFIKIKKDAKEQTQELHKLEGGYIKLPSVQKIMEGMGPGFRNDGAKVIAIACKIDNKTDNEVDSIMRDYVNKSSQIGHAFQFSEAIAWWHWVKQQPKIFWNNSLVEKLGVYNKNEDPIQKLKNADALTLLTHKTLLKKIIDEISIDVKGERKNIGLIFLLMLSCKFPVDKSWNIKGDPQPGSIILSSESSSGKSYITKQILKLFGEEGIDYYTFSRITSAVLNYFSGINMNGKILFVEEIQGLDKESNQLRLWISEGRLKLATVEKVTDGAGNETNCLVIKQTEGQPVFVSSTAEDVIDTQLNNRSWLISMDLTKEQTLAIIKYQEDLIQGSVSQSKSNLELIRKALKELKPYHIRIPYLNHELLNIPINNVRIRRDFKKFRDLICCSALLHQHQRPKFIDENSVEYLIATLDDYDIAKYYGEDVLQHTLDGLTVQQMDVYNRILESPWKEEFTTINVQAITRFGQSRVSTILTQLEEHGLIGSDRSYGKSTIYHVVQSKQLNHLNLPKREEIIKILEAVCPTFLKIQNEQLASPIFYSQFLDDIKNSEEVKNGINKYWRDGCLLQEEILKKLNFKVNDSENGSCVCGAKTQNPENTIQTVSKIEVFNGNGEQITQESNCLFQEGSDSPLTAHTQTPHVRNNKNLYNINTNTDSFFSMGGTEFSKAVVCVEEKNSSDENGRNHTQHYLPSKQPVVVYPEELNKILKYFEGKNEMVDYIDLVKVFGESVENALNTLKKSGEIFEPRPGRLMLLK